MSIEYDDDNNEVEMVHSTWATLDDLTRSGIVRPTPPGARTTITTTPQPPNTDIKPRRTINRSMSVSQGSALHLLAIYRNVEPPGLIMRIMARFHLYHPQS